MCMSVKNKIKNYMCMYVMKNTILKWNPCAVWDPLILMQTWFAGGFNDTLCGIVQYTNLYGTAIGYTIAGAISMM
jgi:hypothetical protein